MALSQVANGDTGLQARTKINAGLTAVDGLTAAVDIPGLNLLNFKAGQFQNARRGLASVQTAQGRAIFAIIGDSTSTGSGAGTGTSQVTDANVLKPSRWLADMITGKAGMQTNVEMFLGDGGVTTGAGSTITAYDPRIVLGTGWSFSGTGLYANGTTTDAVTFTPATPVDTFEITMANTGSVLGFTIGGAAPTTGGSSITLPSTTVVSKTIITGASASLAPLAISRVSGTARFIGVRAWNSTVAPKLDVITYSIHGTTAGIMVNSTGGIQYGDIWKSIGASLYFFNVMLNDIPGTSIASYKTSISTACDLARAAGGDIVLVVPPAKNGVTDAVFQTYIAAVKEVALAKDCTVLDLYTRFGGVYSAASGTRWYYNNGSDGTHGTRFMYADVGRAYADLVSAL